MLPVTTDPPDAARPHDRLVDRAADRLREARAHRSAVVLVVAALVLGRVVLFALQQVFVATGDVAGLRAADFASGLVATVVDVIILFVVLLLFESLRRVDREADRLQTFMDNVYRARR